MRPILLTILLLAGTRAYAVNGCPDGTTLMTSNQHDTCSDDQGCDPPYACRPTKLGCQCELADDPAVIPTPKDAKAEKQG